ncbi:MULTISPECIES: hypothetical protein [Sphingobacterium]|uniref:hypothetical protein n=1 Tax=Sphingobacterium TaxID=28453 RepID=UPI00257F08E9|nr:MULTISPECIES: hypothetical protein [Sphingobacterium]
MITNQLKNKKILFLCVRTFGLENQIIAKLKSYGADVVFYDERIKDTNLTKAIIRVKKSLYKSKIERYYKRILLETKDIDFSYLLVVRGEVVPVFFLEEFKKQHPSCCLIFYNWDSFRNTPNTSNHLHLYDRKFSFDPGDAKKFGINFRPLYFIDSYSQISGSVSKRYDLLFLGTAHSDRYVISSQIKEYFENHGRSAFCYYFMHSKWVYHFKRLFDKTFKNFDIKKISFKSLTIHEMLSLYEQSNVILDINHPMQKGLTMRTFESIGAQKKLITTNSEIVKFDFFNSDNIFVLDRDNINVDLEWLDKPYQPIDREIYHRLSISGWLYNLFLDEDSSYWSDFI